MTTLISRWYHRLLVVKLRRWAEAVRRLRRCKNGKCHTMLGLCFHWLSEFLRFPFFIFLHTFLQHDLHVKGVADVSSSGLYQLALGQLKRETWPTRPHPFWIWTCHNGIDMPLLETWPLKYKELYIITKSWECASWHLRMTVPCKNEYPAVRTWCSTPWCGEW